MAQGSNNIESELDGDLSLDEAGLGDLSLDDEELFADLDNEIRMDSDDPGTEAVESEADSADELSLDEAPAAADTGSDDLDLDLSGGGDDLDLDLDLGGDDDLGLDLGDDLDLDLDLGGDDDLDLDLGEADAAADAGGEDLDLGESPPSETGGDDLDLDLDLGDEGGAVDAAADGEELDLALGAGATDEAGGDDLDLDLDDSDAASAADADELTLGEEDLNLELEAEETAAAPGVELEADADDLAAEIPEESLELAGLEDLTVESPDVSDESEPAGGAPFVAVPDLDLDEVDLALEVPDASLDEVEAPDFGEDTSVPPAGDAGGMPASAVGSEELLDLNLDDLEPMLPDEGPALQQEQIANISEPEAAERLEVPVEPVPGEAPAPALQAMADSEPALTPDEQMAAMFTDAVEAPPPPAPGPLSAAAPVAPAAAPGLELDTDLLLSIPQNITVEMGSVDLNGQEILDLQYGSVVLLNRTVGEPVELVLKGNSIAQGEIVLINGKDLGVRIISLYRNHWS